MALILNKLCFGLEWSTAINDSKNELASLVATYKANAYTVFSNGGVSAYGLGSAKKPSGSQSAAAVFATICGHENAVFVHNLGDQCALIAIEDGMPVEGMDKVGPRNDMLNAANEYVEQQRSSGATVQRFGDADYAEWESEDYQVMAIDAFAECDPDVGKMHAVRDVKAKAALVVLGLLFGTGAWFNNEIIQWFSPPKPTAQIETPQSRYHHQVQTAIQEVEKQAAFRADLIPAFSEFSTKLPYSTPGWQLESLTCNKNDCKGRWRRVKGGNAEAMLAALNVAKDDASVSFPTVDQLEKKMQFASPPTTQKLEFSPNGTLDPKVLTWIQTLKDNGFDPKYGTPTRLVAPDPNLTPDAQDNVLVGEYSFTLPYRDLADAMKLPNSMTIEVIGVTVAESKINVSISGKYYAR